MPVEVEVITGEPGALPRSVPLAALILAADYGLDVRLVVRVVDDGVGEAPQVLVHGRPVAPRVEEIVNAALKSLLEGFTGFGVLTGPRRAWASAYEGG